LGSSLREASANGGAGEAFAAGAKAAATSACSV
jgi:hypothetical protein